MTGVILMIKPGDKVSWLEGGTRKYGWVRAIIERPWSKAALLDSGQEVELICLRREPIR